MADRAPLGLLLAWLALGHKSEDKAGHREADTLRRLAGPEEHAFRAGHQDVPGMENLFAREEGGGAAANDEPLRVA